MRRLSWPLAWRFATLFMPVGAGISRPGRIRAPIVFTVLPTRSPRFFCWELLFWLLSNRSETLRRIRKTLTRDTVHFNGTGMEVTVMYLVRASSLPYPLPFPDTFLSLFPKIGSCRSERGFVSSAEKVQAASPSSPTVPPDCLEQVKTGTGAY